MKDPAKAILSKTLPADLSQNIKAIETLLGNDKAALNTFRAKNWLPFQAFEDVLESDEGELEEKPFLMCTLNQSDKAYRSPWTNRYYIIKETDDGEEDIEIYEKKIPEDEKEIRAIEKAANEVWDAYTQLYYGRDGAVGSVFLRPRGIHGSFEGIFGIHKTTDSEASWDSVHVVTVDEPNEVAKTCDYKVESAVTVSLKPYDSCSVSSSLTKETFKTCKIKYSSLTGSHLENLGVIMEAVEIDFRSKLERVDMPKSLEVMESAYQKQRASGTAHLILGKEAEEAPSMATGMGVGANMIGEIANKAKLKMGGGPNPFMEAMQANQKRREASMKTGTGGDSSGHYSDLKKGLKKNPNPLAGEAMAAMKKKESQGGDEYTDLRAGLKKRGTTPKPAPPVASPTPEFMDFRNKLKKSGAKK